ncbi:MAG: hypothetical protein AAF363_16905 [Bacteroidota bacterium]
MRLLDNIKFIPLFFLLLHSVMGQSSLRSGIDGVLLDAASNKLIGAKLEEEGKFFIHDDFLIGDLKSYGLGKLEDVPMRYDLFRDQMEIVIKGDKFALKENYIKSFSWYDTKSFRRSRYVNVRDFEFKDYDKKGFIEIIFEDSVSLGFIKDISVIRGSESPTLVPDANNDRIVELANYFILENENALELSNSKKKNVPIFGKYWNKLSTFVKQQKLSFRKEEDLIRIVKKYNELKKMNW